MTFKQYGHWHHANENDLKTDWLEWVMLALAMLAYVMLGIVACLMCLATCIPVALYRAVRPASHALQPTNVIRAKFGDKVHGNF